MMATLPVRTEPDSRRCPKCRGALWFSTRYPVVNEGITQPGGAVRFEAAWLCENPLCDYHQLLGETK